MTISARSPCSRLSRRARARISVGDRAAVSSMNSGRSASHCTAWVRRGHSSSSSLPVRTRCWSMRPREEIRRSARESPGISMLKMATGRWTCRATFSAMFMAKLVLWTQMSLATKLCVTGMVRSYTGCTPRQLMAVIASQPTAGRAGAGALSRQTARQRRWAPGVARVSRQVPGAAGSARRRLATRPKRSSRCCRRRPRAALAGA